MLAGIIRYVLVTGKKVPVAEVWRFPSSIIIILVSQKAKAILTLTDQRKMFKHQARIAHRQGGAPPALVSSPEHIGFIRV